VQLGGHRPDLGRAGLDGDGADIGGRDPGQAAAQRLVGPGRRDDRDQAGPLAAGEGFGGGKRVGAGGDEQAALAAGG
jgi:hypothetical protein